MQPRPQNATHTLLLVVTFVLIFLMAARTPLDSDLWWHLRSGEETLRLGQPLMVDLFSHTRYGEHWINHSWLSQVGMILLYRAGGYLALGGAVALLATLSMFLVSLQCEGPAGVKAAALILGSVVASVVWAPRPQLLSLVLMALVAYLLYLYKRRGRDYVVLLPGIFALWSNLHGGYVLGFLLVGAVVAGEVLNHLASLPVEHRLSWRQIGKLLLWTGLGWVAILINPNGLDVWRIPFQTVNVGALQQFISEWASPDFHQLVQQTLLWLLFAVLAAVALSGRVLDGADLAVLVFFGLMALVARRNYGPFALVAVPVLVRKINEAVEAWQGRARWPEWALRLWSGGSQAAAPGPMKAINLALAGFLILAALLKLYIVTHPALVNSYIREQYPVRAMAWLAEHNPPGKLLNEYTWGGYLLWSLRQEPVFVDGRTDLFGDDVIGDWMVAVEAGQGWEEVLARRGVGLVLLEPGRPLPAKLQAAGWQPYYQDDQAVIYGLPE